MVRILQFGATGQIAREMLARAEGRAEIAALSRAEVDLSDTAAVEAAVMAADADLVLNAAAYTAVDQAEAEEALAFAVNASAPGAMARACRARELPLVHISTDYVFDGEKDGAWTEDDPTAPLGAYGRSKLAGEQAVAEAGAEALVLRTSWVFSPHGRNFVKTMLALAQARPELRVVDDQHGRPTAAGDIAEFILAAAPRLVRREAGLTGVFHFAGEGVTTWRRFAEAIFDASAGPRPAVTPITTTEFPTPARRPRNSELDCGKLEHLFGVRPRPWREGLAETLKALEGK